MRIWTKVKCIALEKFLPFDKCLRNTLYINKLQWTKLPQSYRRKYFFSSFHLFCVSRLCYPWNFVYVYNIFWKYVYIYIKAINNSMLYWHIFLLAPNEDLGHYFFHTYPTLVIKCFPPPFTFKNTLLYITINFALYISSTIKLAVALCQLWQGMLNLKISIIFYFWRSRCTTDVSSGHCYSTHCLLTVGRNLKENL